MAVNNNQSDSGALPFQQVNTAQQFLPSRTFPATNGISGNGVMVLKPGGTLASPTAIKQAQTKDPSGSNGVPEALLGIQATQEPTITTGQADRVFSNVTVTFQYDANDPNYDHTNLWVRGYKGNSNPILYASAHTGPANFLLEATGEPVAIYGQPTSSQGVNAPVLFCKFANVTLSGVVSAPPAPTITQTLIATPVGYQFSFAYEGGLLQDVVSGYNIYRNTSNTTVGANNVKNVPQPSTNTGDYVYQETVPAGTNYYYWVTAVNTTGLESGFSSAQSGLVTNNSQLNPDGTSNIAGFGKNVLANPGFELKGTPNAYNTDVTGGLVCNGWAIIALDAGFWVTQCEQDSESNTGSNNLLIRFPSSASLPSDNTYRSCRVMSPAIPVYGGQQMMVDGMWNWQSNIGALPAGVTGLQRIAILFYQANGSQISEAGPPDLTGVSSSYTNSGYETVAVPTNASYCRVELCAFIKNNSGSTFHPGGSNLYMDLRFDDIELVLLNNIDNDVVDGLSYQRSVLGATLTPDIPYNGDFEQFASTQNVADGWTQSFEIATNDAVYSRNGAGYSGTYSQAITNSGGFATGGSIASRPFSVKAGVTYTLTCYADSSLANPGSMYLRVLWYSQDNNLTRAGAASTNDVVSAGGPTAANAWQHFSGTVLAPAGALYGRIACYNWVAGTASTILFDRVTMVPTTYDLDNTIANGTTFGKVNNTALVGGNVNLAGSGVLSIGNTPFSVTGGFSYTTTTSSITWTWTGLQILRSDGTTQNIINGSQAVTGLSSSTTYYFYPYWDETLSQVKFVTGGSGSPAVAQSAVSASKLQTQNVQSRIPLSLGGIAAATPSSGTGGGSGGGGGGGGCFTGNVAIKTPNGYIRFDELPAEFYIENLTGIHKAKLLVHENYSDDFVSISKGKLVTVGHGMKSKDGWVGAKKYFGGPVVHHDNITVYNIHVFTELEDDRHYILETGDVAHNAAKVL